MSMNADMRDVSRCRRRLHHSESILIEDSVLPFACALGHDYSPDDQFAFPYFGAFRWRVGSFERLIDPNTILKVNGGEEFFESHPIQGIGHASLILTPGPALLDELRTLFKRRSGGEEPTVSPIADRTRLRVHDLVVGDSSPLKRDEVAVELLRGAMRADAGVSLRTSRLVERAKEILHAHFAAPVSLGWIARQLGVTPVYLTQVFRRQEGVPLYRYQTRLRLNRALALLPQYESITELAMDLGYSSHAHFTAAFSAAFRVTPTAYRAARRISHTRAG
jgi:AraC family transcriptional regulator